MPKRTWLHIICWLACAALLTVIYRIGLPGYGVAFPVILLFMPLYIGYYYTVAYLVIPRYLFSRKYLQGALALLACIFLAALLFRIIEITLADPYIYRVYVAHNGPLVWHKLEGGFREQLLKPAYIINALEQSNLVICVALSLKFFKMWYEKRQAALQSELNFLKMQIHPHFLFNTLNNLYSLTLQQSPRSPDIVLGLSNILRYMLYECDAGTVPLQRDIDILQNYVKLEQLRYEDRLDFTFSITGRPDAYRIPPLLMLPLVENAFKHGASETVDTPWINIGLQVNDHKLTFKVANSKPVSMPGQAEKNIGSIGLKNVKQRLDLLFHRNYSLLLFDEEEEVFVAILEINLAHYPHLVKPAAAGIPSPALKKQKYEDQDADRGR